MLTIFIKLSLILIAPFLIPVPVTDVSIITVLLLVLSITALNQYLNLPNVAVLTMVFLLALSFFIPYFVAFFPLICFTLLEFEPNKEDTSNVATLGGIILRPSFLLFLVVFPMVIHRYFFAVETLVMIIIITVISGITRYICNQLKVALIKNQEIRDNSIELQLALQNKNKALAENLDADIYLATLRERNRIAREIHDNVGHLLSRSILQIGAVSAINQSHEMEASLESVKETLDLAMTSIRQSVHDLHDDSIDLREAVGKMIEPVPFQVELNYDVSGNIENNVKFCFLGVLKEGITNISKHSNATRTIITLKEHPAFYQLLIHDNGSVSSEKVGVGMGLENMKERVEALDGYFALTIDDGFKIFISIPKKSA